MMDPAEDQIFAIEAEYQRKRRQYLSKLFPQLGLEGRPRIGLSLSGGGIRSATLSLGVLQSLSRLNLIHKFDYLSTVSGGGYTGSFYGSLFTPPEARGARGSGWTTPAENTDPLGTELGQAGIRHLRENGRYLAPSSGDGLKIAVVAVRGWLAVQLAIGAALVTAFLGLNLLRAALIRTGPLHDLDVGFASEHRMTLIWPVEWLQGFQAGGWVLSPLIPVVVAMLGVTVSLGWAYWLTRYDMISPRRWGRILGPSTFGTLMVGGLCLVVPTYPEPLKAAFQVIGILALFAVDFYVTAQLRGSRQDKQALMVETDHGGRSGVRSEEESRVRNILTNWTATMLKVAMALAALALVETISQTLYTMFLMQDGWRKAIKLAAITGIVIPVVRQIVGMVQKSGDFAGILRRFGRTVAMLCALAIAFVLALLWATVAQYLAWRGGPIGGLPAPLAVIPQIQLPSLAWMFVSFFVIAMLINLSVGFLNLSTFSAFYAGRLRRAYLGASNPDRTSEGDGRNAVVNDDQGDDVTLWQYYWSAPKAAPSSGAPLHLINVTLNETTGGRNGGLVQRDRKGRPMTISPAGYLFPGDDTKLRRFAFHADSGERSSREQSDETGLSRFASGRTDLPLSNWVAISGAALSTGLGRNTSLGLSLLAGLSNLRLGVWWPRPDAKLSLSFRPTEGVFPHLWKEFTAKFHGIDGQRWYLTDGGHFENTGVYELVRRRVELIVCCDHGADPDYTFEDIVNLARKLRVDFGAEIEFLSKNKLDDLLGTGWPERGMFGELGELVRYSKEKGGHGPYAAIARIRIPEPATSDAKPYCATLILLKPRLTGLEMVDLVDYHRVDQTFPQQTTGDQFFDEAQWESYFRLGATIADRVFGAHSQIGQGWVPGALEPVSGPGFEWFCKDWAAEQPAKEQSEDAKDCTCPPVAVTAAPGAGSSSAGFGGLGMGKVILALVAGLGTAGIATGVGQQLTGIAVQSMTSSSPTTPAAPDDDAIPAGAPSYDPPPTGTVDPVIAERLGRIVNQLDTLIARPAASASFTDAVGAGGLQQQLIGLRVALQSFTRSQDPATLRRILAEMERLRQASTASDEATRLELRKIDASLKDVSRGVREVAPRRNIRGGAQ